MEYRGRKLRGTCKPRLLGKWPSKRRWMCVVANILVPEITVLSLQCSHLELFGGSCLDCCNVYKPRNLTCFLAYASVSEVILFRAI